MKSAIRTIRLGLFFLLVLGVLDLSWSYTPAVAKPQPSTASGGLTTLASAPFTLAAGQPGGIVVGRSVRNDTSPALRDMPAAPLRLQKEHEASPALRVPIQHEDAPDPVVQSSLAPLAMPTTTLNFEGIPYPGVACNCAPPDTNGEVGATQYVQMVNEGIQVFTKTTGTSALGPIGISTLWTGFGGVCQTNGSGDPIVLYDQIANRWVVSQFAGASVPTDECIAVSTTSDATGSWYRYDFNLGTNFFDYPKLGVWPDAYYMSMNVFNTAGTVFLGPQPFAFDRAAMLAGNPATFISPGLQPVALGSLLPADLDGLTLPPAGAPNPWLSAELPTWQLYRFHVDWVIPANSTFTLGGNLTPAAYTVLTANVPQLGTTSLLDTLADRPMFRLAYRRFGDGHEALVSNLTVNSGGVAGIRWWEINNATSGTPSFVQQGTYQPDTTWRWMGSAAMDAQGDLAVGFSASSGSIYPQIRYAGRLAGDPANTLAQGEATLFAGTGSQTGTSGRWGDYSDLTVDPVDDCTFWYTNEYYATTTSFNWRTRIGSFKFPSCTAVPDFTLSAAPATQAICAPSSAVYTATVGSFSGYSSLVTLSANGHPAGTTAAFSVNPVTPPGTSLLTIGNTGAASAGSYNIDVVGVSTTHTHTTTVGLNLYIAAPGAPTLTSPANGAANVAAQPTFTWTAISQAASYILEIATDAGFTNIVHSAPGLIGTSYNGATLNTSTTYYWRVRASNACGASANSTAFSFTTVAGPGDCSPGTSPNILYSNDFEAGATGWTHSAITGTDTWALTTTNPHSGVQAWHADDPASVDDQRLVSPPVILPAGQNPLTLKFWNWQHMETRTGGCFDGGILEVTTDGGSSWTQVISPSLLTDPYDGPVSASFSNPLANLNAWCGNNPQPYLNSLVDISAYAGQTAQFRFRLGSDNSVSRPGWNIDDVVVQSCQANAAPSFLSVNVTPGAVSENGVITLTGTLTDSDALDTHTLVVGWGDSAVTQTLPTLGVGVYAFTATHQYLDDNPAGTPSDINTINLTLSDSYGHTAITTTHVTVNNVPPQLLNLSATSPISENNVVTVTGKIGDPGAQDTFTLTVNWADGSGLQTFNYPAGASAFTATHLYQNNLLLRLLEPLGNFGIQLTLTDDDLGSSTSSVTVTVNNVAPTLSNVAVSSIYENGTATLTGRIFDPGPLDTFTLNVNWGDATLITYTYPAGTTAFTQTHKYLDDNPTGTPSDLYTVTLTVVDNNGGMGTATANLIVTNVPPQLMNLASSAAAINENDVLTVTGTISEPGTLDTFQVVVNWGDGSAPETFNYPAGATNLAQSHRYRDDNPSSTASDVYTISVTVRDDDTGAGNGSLTVTVNNLAPVVNVGPDRQTQSNVAIQFNGVYTDTGTLDTHTYAWNFGDGATVTGTLTPTHAYTAAGTFTTTLTITDDDTGVGSDSLIVQVRPWYIYLPLVLKNN